MPWLIATICAGLIVFAVFYGYHFYIMESWERILAVKTESVEKKGKKIYYLYYHSLKYEYDEDTPPSKAIITEKTYNEIIPDVRYRALFKGLHKIILARQIDTT